MAKAVAWRGVADARGMRLKSVRIRADPIASINLIIGEKRRGDGSTGK